MTVTVVITDRFVERVNAIKQDVADRLGRPTDLFNADRLAGTVVAKNIATNADDSEITIVFNAEICPAGETVVEQIMLTFLLVHELTHPLLGGLRRASGAGQGEPPNPWTPSEHARTMGRDAVDEYICDRVAAAAIVAIAEHSPPDMTELNPYTEDHREGFADVAAQLHPGWPQMVEDYRDRRLPLQELWGQIRWQTDNAVKALAHIQAGADSEGRPMPHDAEHAALPAAKLYLGPAWRSIWAVVGPLADPAVLSLDTFAARDQAIADQFEEGLFALWQTLGITVTEQHPSGSGEPTAGDFHLKVTEPVR